MNKSFVSPSKSSTHKRYSSVRPSSSMAEENQVQNFSLFHGNQHIDSLMPTNQPQRIELPIFFNTPIRNTTKRSKLPEIQTYLSSNRRIKDYELLAFACRRASKQRDEGRAYFSMGVLYDNLGKFEKAIASYKKFLEVCKLIGDVHGEGLAYNCIGVDYLLLSEEKPEKINDAIEYHKKHEEVSDLNGKFLACINLGLCYDKTQDSKLSLFHYQNALKYAVKMSNLVGQSIAIGNIGKIGTKGLYENTDKMKAFVERYIKIASELQDSKGLFKGHVKLGMISASRGYFNNIYYQLLKSLGNDIVIFRLIQSSKVWVCDIQCRMFDELLFATILLNIKLEIMNENVIFIFAQITILNFMLQQQENPTFTQKLLLQSLNHSERDVTQVKSINSYQSADGKRPPKYIMQLNLQQEIFWKVNASINKITSMGFLYKGKIKYFEGTYENLEYIKKSLSKLVIYKNIKNFYEPIKLLGRGECSQVHLVKNKLTQNLYACKCVDKSLLEKMGGFKQLQTKIQAMSKLNHPNIVQLVEVFDGAKTIYLVEEYLQGGSLQDFIQKHIDQKQTISNQVIRQILKALLDGVRFIHQNNFIHRDISPDNILFQNADDIQSLKIIDFGLVQELGLELIFPVCGTPGFMAPETANYKSGDKRYSLSCDMFSVGVIFYKLLTLDDLFKGKDYSEVYRENKKCSINIERAKQLSTAVIAIDLLKKMLDINPESRISAASALQHMFLKDRVSVSGNLLDPKFMKSRFQSSKLQEEYKPPWKSYDFVLHESDEEDLKIINFSDQHMNQVPVLTTKERDYQHMQTMLTLNKDSHKSLSLTQAGKFNRHQFTPTLVADGEIDTY